MYLTAHAITHQNDQADHNRTSARRGRPLSQTVHSRQDPPPPGAGMSDQAETQTMNLASIPGHQQQQHGDGDDRVDDAA